MPKIPTYDQLGQKVKAPATQLGLRADPALASSALATADAFNRASDVAYQFGMKEKEENTKAAYNELQSLYTDEANDLIRNSKKIDTESAQKELNDFNTKFEKNYQNRGLTPNQIKAVKTKMILHQSNKMQNHKTLSFDRGRDYNSDLHNKSLVNLEMEINKLPQGNPLRKYMMDEALEIYQIAEENGETGNLEVKSFVEFEKKIKLIDYSLLSTNAKSIEDLNKLKSSVDNETLLHSEKVNILNDIKVNETRVLSEYVEALSMDVFQAEKKEFLNDEDFEKELQRLLKLEKIETVNAKGQAITIDLKKLSSNQLRTIKNLATNKKNELEAEELNDVRNTEIKSAQTMTLSQIVKTEKAIDNGSYRPEIKNFAARQAIKSVYSDMKGRREKEDISIAKSNIDIIKTSISSNKGVVDEKTKELIKTTSDMLALTENFDMQKALNQGVESSSKSSAIFLSTQFSSPLDKTKAEKVARNDYLNETDLAKKKLKQDIYTELLQKNATASKEFTKDPVDYLQNQLNVTLFPSERINKQKTMGVVGSKLRVATNAEIEQFRAEFSNQVSFQEKAKVGEKFINSFGVENANLVMKNLVQTKVISKVESLMLSDPYNPKMNFVVTANSEAAIAEHGKPGFKVTKKDMTSIMDNVYKQMSNYSTSIVGNAYKGEADPSFTTPAHSHLIDTAEIIKNTAILLVQKGEGHASAAKTAYNMVLGDSHEFFEINNKAIRVEKGSGYNSEGIKGVLSFIINNKDNLSTSIISAEKAGIATSVTNEEYINDISSKGAWKTTVDNSGVYLVDGTGNMVRRKDYSGSSDVSGSGIIDQTSPFVVIKFDKLNAISQELSDIRGQFGGGAYLKKGQAEEEFLKRRAIF